MHQFDSCNSPYLSTFFSSKQGFPDSVGADVNAIDEEQEIPLHLAAEYACSYSAELLLENGSEINSKNRNGDTPLHIASRYAGMPNYNDYDKRKRAVASLGIIKSLLEHGALRDLKNKANLTPLEEAEYRYEKGGKENYLQAIFLLKNI